MNIFGENSYLKFAKLERNYENDSSLANFFPFKMNYLEIISSLANFYFSVKNKKKSKINV